MDLPYNSSVFRQNCQIDRLPTPFALDTFSCNFDVSNALNVCPPSTSINR